LNESTRADYARRYGLLLDHQARTCGPNPAAECAANVVPEIMATFIAELQGRVRSVTVAKTVYKVRRTAELIAPERNFTWLREIEKDLELLAIPMDKSHRVVATSRLVEAGLSLFAQAEISQSMSGIEAALLARNGLMIAILALCPIRLTNFVELEIGSSFIEHHGTWWIVLRDTKSGCPDERPLPDYVKPLVDEYLTRYRPQLLSNQRGVSALVTTGIVSPHLTPRPAGGPLWVSSFHKALGKSQTSRALVETTCSTLGISVSAHLFRSAAATTAALYASHMPHLASVVLQHKDPHVTEEHYNRANSLTVAAQYAQIVRELR
jgi:integrase